MKTILNNVVNVDNWLTENKENFHPPVCNGLLSKSFLSIMFVGGPNTRKDYHIEQGEELFYMLKGDMCLKIMERGEPRDIHIKEGEVFVLPSRIPHSPQRNANTLGMVIERERSNQWDCLRYFCEDGKTILWHKYFNLHDLVKDLPPVIKEYFASEQYKTGIPVPGTTDEDDNKLKVDVLSTVDDPFSLDQWVEQNFSEIKSGSKLLFSKGEFQVNVFGGHYEYAYPYETWVWIKCGEASGSINGKNITLQSGDSIVISENEKVSLKIENDNGYGMVFAMNPLATPQ